MPQLPTSTAEEYGAEDEIKQYTQEEDEGSDTSTVDVVNDIKDDLLNEDGRDSVKEDDQLFQPTSISNRYGKGDGQGLVYGRPAPVIVGPNHTFYNHVGQNGFSRTTGSNISQHPTSYPSSTQIRIPSSYQRDERIYDHPWGSQVPVPPHYSPYGAGVQKIANYRYHPSMHPSVPYYPPGHGYIGMPGRPVKEPKRPHVKKPLNAFMLFMKEQRPKIAAEFTLKESAAINQILGKRWHALDKSEQAKYYEMARKERAIHMQMYPGWSARDNYAQLGRKKKRPRDKNEEMNPKKCRARYGLDRQEQWCKPCRRKKKCIRFIVGADGETTEIVPEKEEINSDSDNDNVENRTQKFNTMNNNHQEPATKENVERVTMANAKETLDALVTNNNNINILSDSSKYVNSTSSAISQFTPKGESQFETHKQDQLKSELSPPPSTIVQTSTNMDISTRAIYTSINCTTQPDKPEHNEILKTISAPCS